MDQRFERDGESSLGKSTEVGLFSPGNISCSSFSPSTCRRDNGSAPGLETEGCL